MSQNLSKLPTIVIALAADVLALLHMPAMGLQISTG
jgi:hypothetical protein